jgi:hypothetical protein
MIFKHIKLPETHLLLEWWDESCSQIIEFTKESKIPWTKPSFEETLEFLRFGVLEANGYETSGLSKDGPIHDGKIIDLRNKKEMLVALCLSILMCGIKTSQLKEGNSS